MINQDQRDELKEMLLDVKNRQKELDIYYGSEYLAKEYLALHERFQRLKFRIKSLEH